MIWTNDLVIEFLELYEKEALLWNASHPKHKNRNEAHDAWKRIETGLNGRFSVAELKKKKESLMASFRTCQKKIKGSLKSGTGTDDIFKPNWFAFDTMDRFLSDKDQPRETLNTEDGTEKVIEASPDDIDTPDIDVNAVDSQPESAASQTPTFKPPSRKKKKVKSEEHDNDELRKKVDSAFEILQTSLCKPSKEKGVCDIHGELVAAKLKAMDESTREYCMNRIDNLLFEAKAFGISHSYAASGHNRYFYSQPPPSSSQHYYSSAQNSPSPQPTATPGQTEGDEQRNPEDDHQHLSQYCSNFA